MIFKTTLVLILILTSSYGFSQVKDPFKLMPQKYKYKISDSCTYEFEWQSIKMKNKKIGKIINASIKSNSLAFINNESYKIESICDTSKEVTYSFNSKIVFANDKIISTYLNSITDWQNYRPAQNAYKTINYNSKTGEIVSFNSLILKNKIAEIDTLIIHKLTETMNEYKQEDEDVFDTQHWEEQLNNLSYTLSENGINIIMTNLGSGYNSNSWMQQLFLSFDEIKEFIYDKDLFK